MKSPSTIITFPGRAGSGLLEFATPKRGPVSVLHEQLNGFLGDYLEQEATRSTGHRYPNASKVCF